MRKILIPWSGGWDSTYLILDAIKNNIEFETCYITLPNNIEQQKLELSNRSLLKDLITKKFNTDWVDTKYKFVGILDNVELNPSSQPFIWLTSIVWNIDTKKIKCIQFGYLRNSHLWHNKEKFKKAFNSLLRLTKIHNYKKVKVQFPLEWYNKTGILDGMKFILGDDYGAFEFLIQTCEAPFDGFACGKCNKCKEIQNEQSN